MQYTQNTPVYIYVDIHRYKLDTDIEYLLLLESNNNNNNNNETKRIKPK